MGTIPGRVGFRIQIGLIGLVCIIAFAAVYSFSNAKISVVEAAPQRAIDGHIQVSSSQVARFADAVGQNARPVQTRNNRLAMTSLSSLASN
jgi:hypothetical protein